MSHAASLTRQSSADCASGARSRTNQEVDDATIVHHLAGLAEGQLEAGVKFKLGQNECDDMYQDVLVRLRGTGNSRLAHSSPALLPPEGAPPWSPIDVSR